MVSVGAPAHAVPMTYPPRWLMVTGPSGAGKSSVVRELHRRRAAVVRPTWTTRPPRDDELDGSLEHRFASDEEFDGLRDAGFFCHTGAIAGLPGRYGLPPFVPHDVGPPDAVIVRAPYVGPLARLVPGSVVYQIGDRPDEIARRLRARGCPPSELDARMRDNIAEAAAGRRVADRTFMNEGTLEELVETVTQAMAIDFPGRAEAVRALVAS
jgi:guanylate kinase